MTLRDGQTAPGATGMPPDVAWLTSYGRQALRETGLVGAGRFLSARSLREDVLALRGEPDCGGWRPDPPALDGIRTRRLERGEGLAGGFREEQA